MAQVFPSLEQIHQLRSKPTEGELHLLKFLSENLDNNYEIYFQPFLNGDRPDIILMRPDAGVMIFEVKDWNLGSYDINEKKHWFVTQDRKKWSRIKSPIDQVLSYKQNLYDLHIENLLETRIKNPKTWAVVSCAIYFHCENYDKVDNFLTGKFQDNQNEGYRRFLSHLVILGKDSLNRNSLNQFLRKHYLHRQSKFFNDTLYKSFKRHLQPPYHSREEGKPIEYTSKQEELINSPLKQRKIKGVAGSGKTCILAKRAVNALKRISSSVSSSSENHPDILILTYNITLKNYIHDKISQVREDFPRSCFYIKNYHDFINQELNNLGIEIEIPQDFDNWNSEEKSQYFEDEYYSNISLFRNQKQHLYTYKAIFIDEIQDYEEEWVKIIRECFLENGGEFVVFGDEKQNVYQRSMDQYKKPYTGIRGAWKKLEDTLRLSTHLSSLATAFQANFFEQKYEIETINTENLLKLNLNSQEQIIEYIPVTNSSHEYIYNMCNERAIKYMIHPNDICIQSARIEILRNINLYAMQSQQIKTTTTFESLETYYLILLQIIENFNIQNEDLEGQNNIINEIRQYKLRIRELKNIFINNTNNDNINQAIVKALCYGFHINHPVVKQKLTEYLRTKNITRTEYDTWVSQIMPILRQVSRNQAIMNRFKSELEKIRKNKKWNFWMNTGNIKFSTIHSFKGWEVDSLFLIIEREFDDNNFTTDELIYTAITRCRRNLFILDLDQSRYLEFFNSFNHSVIR